MVSHTRWVMKLAAPPALNHMTYILLGSTFPARYPLPGALGMRRLAAAGSLGF